MTDILAGRRGEQWRDEFIAKGTMPKMVRKAFVEVPEIIGELKAAFVISTGDEDRDGDTVNPGGWELESYRKNPVVLWAHSMKELPIGRAEEVAMRGGKLKAMTVFPEPGDYPFADQVRKMVKGGFLKGTSVGFHPIEASPRKGYGKGVAFGKQELYEYSLLPIPSNREALVEAKSAGLDIGIVVKWAESFLEEARESGLYVPVIGIEKALRAVAPVQISVPGLPLDWDAALSAIVEEAKGFDPDQPRDEDGKFASTGGGPAGSVQLSDSDPMARYTAENRADAAERQDRAFGKPSDRRAKDRRKPKEDVLTRADGSRLDLSKLTPKQREGVLDINDRERERKEEQTLAVAHRPYKPKKGIEDNIMDIADDFFEGVSKGTPPWLKEGDKKEEKPAAEAKPAAPPAPGAPPAASAAPPAPGQPAPGAPPAPAPAPGEADPSQAAPVVASPASPAASASTSADPLMQALMAELEPLKQGGDPTQIATAVKAALEKYAAGFMQQYVVPMAAAGMPAGSVGNQNPATPPPGGAPAQSDGKQPPPDQEQKKGFALGNGAFATEDDIRDMIVSATRSAVAEAKTRLTGRLP